MARVRARAGLGLGLGLGAYRVHRPSDSCPGASLASGPCLACLGFGFGVGLGSGLGIGFAPRPVMASREPQSPSWGEGA